MLRLLNPITIERIIVIYLIAIYYDIPNPAKKVKNVKYE